MNITQPSEVVRGLYYRILLLLAIIAVAVAVFAGADAAQIITTATSVAAIVGAILASLNTAGGGIVPRPLPPPELTERVDLG